MGVGKMKTKDIVKLVKKQRKDTTLINTYKKVGKQCDLFYTTVSKIYKESLPKKLRKFKVDWSWESEYDVKITSKQLQQMLLEEVYYITYYVGVIMFTKKDIGKLLCIMSGVNEIKIRVKEV